MVATISALGSVGSKAKTSTSNNTFSLTTTVVGRCVVVFCLINDASKVIDSLSSSNVGEWTKVASFAFTASPMVQTVTVFTGRVRTVATATVTASSSSSLT